MNKYTTIFLLLVAATLSACTSKTFNPYDDAFDCPNSDQGKCISVDGAYQEQIRENDLIYEEELSQSVAPTKPEEKIENDIAWAEGEKNYSGEKIVEAETPAPKTLKYNYQDALYKELTGMLKAPETPLVVPSKTMRVLLLPYTSETNELYGDRFVYFFATEPTWSISTSKEPKTWD